jgi:hypothetical protein
MFAQVRGYRSTVDNKTLTLARIGFAVPGHAAAACCWPFSFAPALNDINPSGVCGKERFVRQAGSEFRDVEGPVEAGVKLLAMGEKADL